jgi:thiol:disulfide interchange protein DsbC
MMMFARFTLSAWLALALLTPTLALAQEATIRKNLAERLPNLPKIDEISKTPMNGLYELRMGNDVMYSDAEGLFLIQGTLIDVKQRRNLTEERMEKLSAIPFDQLPLKNAFTQVRGNGKRKLVVFADPNCGYCKRFEKDLQKLENVTIYHLLYPILGEDSRTKSKNIWCAKDKAKVWNDWMVNGATPSSANCDTTALDANVEFGKKQRITGTPTLFFADGTRVPGAVPIAQVEKLLTEIKP